MVSTYTVWICHGEVHNTNSVLGAGRESRRGEASSSRNVDPVVELVEDLFQRAENFGEDIVEGEHPTTKAAMDAYDELTRLANTPLFAGSNLSCLESLLKLMTIKEKSATSNQSFDMNCEFYINSHPTPNFHPRSYAEAKKMLKKIGMDCIKYAACEFGCILYYKQYELANFCPICRTSRWVDGKQKKKKPRKIVWYFPIIPRLQRLYMSAKTADQMR